MAKARKQKLKVFRTPVGFHDAYVAAPTQKAALEAWGTDTNLFARGTAEQVTDEELMEVPLKHPGEVIKVLRGTKAEQIAALGNVPARAKASRDKMRTAANENSAKAKPQLPRGPKPSRAKLATAEEAISALEKQHAKALRQIERQEQALARERRDLERKHAKRRGELEEKAARERERYQRELQAWEEY